MKYVLDESLIDALKDRIMLQSDLKKHQFYPNIIDLNIKDFVLNEAILLSYCNDKEPKEMIESLVQSFKDHRKIAPLVVDKNNYLVDGYHRYLACLQLGIDYIPVIKLNVTLGK